jgi:predicted DNA-binding transcriptional regulator AlpA
VVTRPSERELISAHFFGAACGNEGDAPSVRGKPEWAGSEDELLDARQAAALLTLKPSTLLAWARDGRVPVIRLGPRHLRWTRPMLRQIRDAALDPGKSRI